MQWCSRDCPLRMPYRHLFCLRQAFLTRFEKLPQACIVHHNFEKNLFKM